MSAEMPTTAEIQKVQRWECSTRGHSFSEVMVYGRLAPQLVHCTRCGSRWEVVNPEANWGDGTGDHSTG